MQEEIRIDVKGDIVDVLTKLNKGFEELRGDVDNVRKTAGESLDGISRKMNSISFASFHQNLQNVNQGLQDINAPGMAYNSTLADLSALTGITGSKLSDLGDKAKKSAAEFGGTAAESIGNYKVILSRLGPDIAKSGDALNIMERDVRILSKTMGGDAAGAVDALTTAALQFGVDLSNPNQAAKEMTKMMDVMANSAQLGAAEVPQISAALKVSGVAAKQAHISFIEANAALQAMAAGGKEGSEAGMGLRNVLSKMAGEDIIPKEAAEKLRLLGVNMDVVSNTSLPFTTRLRELKKAQGDATVMAQVFGIENAASANILLDSVDAQDKMALSIGKVGGAQAQANIVMESATEKLARQQAKIDNVKIAIFEATGGFTAYLGPVAQVATTISSLTPIYTGARTAVLALATAKGREALMESNSTAAKVIGNIATKTATAAQWLWNAALTANPIGLVIAGVAALGGAVYALTRYMTAASAVQQADAALKERVAEKTMDQRVELEILFNTMKSAKKGSEEFNETLAKLESMQPGIVEKYALQEGKLQNINAAYKEMVSNIMLVARAEAAKELMKEEMKAAMKAKEEGPSNWNTFLGAVTNPSVTGVFHNKEIADHNTAAKRYASVSAQIDAEMKKKGLKPEGATNSTASSAPPSMPSNNILTGSSSSGPRASSSGSSSSGSGMGEMKRIDVRIETLVKEIHVHSATVRESAAEIKQIVTEALVGSVRDFEVAM